MEILLVWHAVFTESWAVVVPQFILAPIDAAQPGENPLDKGEARIHTAAYYPGKLGWGFNSSCIPNGEFDNEPYLCIGLHEIDIRNPTVLNGDTLVEEAGYDLNYPSLTMNNLGQMLFIFGFTNSVNNPGLMCIRRIGNLNG
jgi:hypothetical protein